PQANGSTFDGRASVIPANTPVLASYCRTVELGIGSSPVVCGPAWQVLWKDGALCWSQAAMTSTEDAIASSCENLIPGDITLTLQWWE
ncbi:MAG TPA: hypothetical protein VEA41_14680, partial [Salinarimonas sp.]|nr:hypothetical protein [Salinarimonas sp.]